MEFVISWTKKPNQDPTPDKRGWKKGKPRKYTDNQEEKVLSIYFSLKDDPSSFFCGATAIQNTWKDYYPQTPIPHLRYIGRVLKKHNLTEKIKRGKNKGASRYLLYPAYTILNTISQGSLLEIDFIQKFIQGESQPLSFLGFSLRGRRPLKHFIRLEEYTQEEVIKGLDEFIHRFESPYAVKMDNDFVFFGPSSKERFLSKVTLYLLLHNIIPIFTAPRRPWNQASIEGTNSVFSRKFWNRGHFSSVAEVDRGLADFNLSYQRYLNYQRPDSFKENKDFSYRVYFIRKVYQEPEETSGYIQIGSKRIILDPAYIHLFTLSKWDLEKEVLYVYIQRERAMISGEPSYYLQLIKKIPFELTQASDKKVVDFYLSYNR